MHQDMKPEILTTASFSESITYLSSKDRDLCHVIDCYGEPPLRFRDPGFPALVRIILEQQVSLASAKAAFDRLVNALDSLQPSSFLTLNDNELRAIGFSRQKARYCRSLAEAVLAEELDLASLEILSDTNVRDELTNMIGIGPWTADIYLITSLRRPDVWPPGDIALMTSYQRLTHLENLPDTTQMKEISDHWRPWRTVAACILWHYYVQGREDR